METQIINNVYKIKTGKELFESEPYEIGGKGFNLIALQKLKLNVPEFAVITSDIFKSFIDSDSNLKHLTEKLYDPAANTKLVLDGISKRIRSASLPKELLLSVKEFVLHINKYGYKKIAIRSSANMEDGQNHSFAGQFKSVLDIQNYYEIEGAIKECWSALYDELVYNYCTNNNLPHQDIRISLLVQGMIPAETSGVVFTIDPVKGDDKTMIIEAVEGIGEKMVSGHVTPQRYSYNWFDEEFVNPQNNNLDESEPLLSKKQLQELCDLALDIQQNYGSPQDIEWAFSNGEFHILQSRPVTKIFFDVKDEWTNANMKDGAVSSSIATPLILSLFKMMINKTMPDYFKQTKLLRKNQPKNWSNSFFGYLYWNLSATKDCIKQLPGFVEREFDEGVGIEPNYKGKGHNTPFSLKTIYKGIKILFALKKSIKNRFSQSRNVIKMGHERLQSLENHNYSNFTDTELANTALKLAEEIYLLVEGGYFYHIYDNSNFRTLFIKMLNNYNKNAEEKIDYLNLIVGLDDIPHLQPMFDLWDISRKMLTNPSLLHIYSQYNITDLVESFKNNRSFPFDNLINPFISKFRHHSFREQDILVPYWIEDPTQVFESLNMILKYNDDQDPKKNKEKQNQIFHKECEKIHSKKIIKTLAKHREFLKIREQMRDYSTLTYYMVRKVYLELGERMIKKRLIKKEDDILFLSYEEINDFSGGNNIDHYKKRIQKNRIFLKSFRNFEKPDEIRASNNTSGIQNIESSGYFKGIPCSPGITINEVVVIENIWDVKSLKPGTILVTKFVDPAWTMSFSCICGLITETGGVLSHGAVISREYGIPAVLAVKNITNTLKTGMIVKLDGNNGIVEITEQSKQPVNA